MNSDGNLPTDEKGKEGKMELMSDFWLGQLLMPFTKTGT